MFEPALRAGWGTLALTRSEPSTSEYGSETFVFVHRLSCRNVSLEITGKLLDVLCEAGHPPYMVLCAPSSDVLVETLFGQYADCLDNLACSTKPDYYPTRSERRWCKPGSPHSPAWIYVSLPHSLIRIDNVDIGAVYRCRVLLQRVGNIVSTGALRAYSTHWVLNCRRLERADFASSLVAFDRDSLWISDPTTDSLVDLFEQDDTDSLRGSDGCLDAYLDDHIAVLSQDSYPVEHDAEWASCDGRYVLNSTNGRPYDFVFTCSITSETVVGDGVVEYTGRSPSPGIPECEFDSFVEAVLAVVGEAESAERRLHLLCFAMFRVLSSFGALSA
ncbi:hypothetical protein C8F01DRAFT_1257733 [Mycena amicta]|nr:hypothetical protein C8F01DRAFT_1257733 [Mycena amicta]